MNCARITFQTILGMLMTTAPLLAAGEQEFEMSRATIDGGGEMRSAGDDFELSGSIGQPDAGVMAGDDFKLTGGFWFGLPPTDCDEDGLVGLLDYERLMTIPCLTGPLGGPPDVDCRCFDVNRDGTVDMADFAVIQSTYTGP